MDKKKRKKKERSGQAETHAFPMHIFGELKGHTKRLKDNIFFKPIKNKSSC